MAKATRKKAVKKAATAAVIDHSKYQYKRHKMRGADGKMRHSASNGDAVANAMFIHIAGGGTLDQVITANKLQDKYGGRRTGNAGTLRMALGKSLRSLVERGEPVKIGKITVSSKNQKVAIPAA